MGRDLDGKLVRRGTGKSPVQQHLILSPEDEELRPFCRWCVSYASLTIDRKEVLLHHYIIKRMGLIIPDGYQIDHINEIGVDNRRENLRVVTVSMNKLNVSSVKGVAYHKAAKKWEAYLTVNYKKRYLGLFLTQEEALKARKAAVKKIWEET